MFMNKNKYASIVAISKNKKNEKKRQKNLFQLIVSTAFYAITAYLFSYIWFEQIMQTLSLNYHASSFFLQNTIILLVMILITLFPKYIGLPLLGISLLTSFLGLIFQNSFGAPIYNFLAKHFTGIFQSIRWLMGSQTNAPKFLPYYFAILSILIATIFIYIKPMPITLTLIWIFPYIISIREDHLKINFITFFIGLMIILITFARQGGLSLIDKKNWQIPPFSLIALILVLLFALQLILPSDLFYSTKVNRYLEQLIKSNQNMPDTVRYFEFSIRDAGFYPNNVRLGGPIEKQDLPFMKVTGPAEPFYLRGTIFNQFETNIWYASNMNKNYLFYNEAPINQQKDAFTYKEKSSLSEEEIEQYFIDASLKIEPIYQPIQAVFHGGKPEQIIDYLNLEHSQMTEQSTDESQTSLESLNEQNDDEVNSESDVLYYFNPDGQIYASEEISNLGYSVSGQISTLAFSEKYFASLINNYQSGDIDFSKQTLSNSKNYRIFLEKHEPDLAQIVYHNNSDKAVQLRSIVNYLKTNFIYNLEVADISENQDLFESFIQTKSGYCTYFATALTILAREAGFEARYVEGFIVPGIKDENLPKDTYERTVSTDQAHAWTEIKIDELGWVAFDATPEIGLDAIQRDVEKEEELKPEISETIETTTQTTQESMPITETTKAPENTNKNQSIDKNKQDNNQIYIFIIITLLLLVLIVLYILWKKKKFDNRHDLKYLMSKLDNQNILLILFVWQDLKQLYQIQFGDLDESNTILRNMNLMMKKFHWKKEDTLMAYRALEKTLYAETETTKTDIQKLMIIYDQAEVFTKENMTKSKWFFKRFLRAKEVKYE